MSNRVEIDCGRCGGDGLVVQSALTLSLVTGRPVRIRGIGQQRPMPGLRSSDVALLATASQVSPGSMLDGVFPGSTEIAFTPAPVRPGRFNFTIAPTGSATHVLQMLALPLALAEGRSRLRIVGGTHIEGSPSFEFLEHVWRPWMRRLGLKVELRLERAGFFPRGGGALDATIQPLDPALQPGLRPITAVAPAKPRRIRVITLQTSDRSRGMERPRTDAFISKLRNQPTLVGPLTEFERTEGRLEFSGSSGTELFAVVEFDHGPAGFRTVGAGGESGEQTNEDSAASLLDFLKSEACVDPFMADQLLVPLARSTGPSRFTTPFSTPALHARINVLKRFLDITIEVADTVNPTRVDITPATTANGIRGDQ